MTPAKKTTAKKAPAKKVAAKPATVETPEVAETPSTPVSAKRDRPAVVVPPAVRWTGNPSTKVRVLQQLLRDLGHYREGITGYYGPTTRNGVSMLQQQLTAEGVYSGIPDGYFDDETREALLASSIPTTPA